MSIHRLTPKSESHILWFGNEVAMFPKMNKVIFDFEQFAPSVVVELYDLIKRNKDEFAPAYDDDAPGAFEYYNYLISQIELALTLNGVEFESETPI
jgi:hypothetical protein